MKTALVVLLTITISAAAGALLQRLGAATETEHNLAAMFWLLVSVITSIRHQIDEWLARLGFD